MRFLPFCLICLCAFLLAGCNKSSSSQDYDPAQTPLTADELALLTGVDHWKIKKFPKADVPNYGVRVVALNADNTVVNYSGTEQFGTSISANGNDQILIGIQREKNGFSGTLILGSRPEATSSGRFTFPHPHDKDSGSESSIGLTWRDDRATLIRCVDENRKTTFTICAELLHQPPK